MSDVSRPIRILHVDSSAHADNSVSRSLSAAFIDRWRKSDPTIAVAYRDLALKPIAHLGNETLQARSFDVDRLTDQQRRERHLTETLIDEFLGADVIVIGAPMYNFSISSQLKAWIDRIVQAGRTFRYTASGPIGLAAGKRVVIISSRGGIYSTSERRALDFQEPYLRLIFGFVGITDISIIRAEGLALGTEAREKAINAAHAEIADFLRQAA